MSLKHVSKTLLKSKPLQKSSCKLQKKEEVDLKAKDVECTWTVETPVVETNPDSWGRMEGSGILKAVSLDCILKEKEKLKEKYIWQIINVLLHFDIIFYPLFICVFN